MFYEKTEIEHILDVGKTILLKRPEFIAMQLCDVLDELDDETPEMARDRWGVIAWIVMNSIKDFDIPSLVDQLSNIAINQLTCEYVGYLLLVERKVNLEELLLQAENSGKFDNIVPFVHGNLIYETEMYENNIIPILRMMENHTAHSLYRSFLGNYAEHISKFQSQHLVASLIGEPDGQTPYDLMYYLRTNWYANNPDEANGITELLIEQKSLWSRKAAIDYLDTGLNYGNLFFQKHFAQVEAIALEDKELWLLVIPLFVKYLIETENNANQHQDETRNQIVKRLNELPNGTLDERYSFLCSLQYKENAPEILQSIIYVIFSKSFNKEKRFLDVLDYYLFLYLRHGECERALQLMQQVFVANEYFSNYEVFFHSIHLFREQLSTYSQNITEFAIEDIFSRNRGRFFFGLGLLVEFGDIQTLSEYKDVEDSVLQFLFTEAQILHLAKALSYFSIDAKKICSIAFQLLEFVTGTNEQYITFCLEELFENYPGTMYQTAKRYFNANQKEQIDLAEKITQKYEEQLEWKTKCFEIRDLAPSKEHNYIFRKALADQERKIRNEANENSILKKLFNKRTLKYGVRNAHILIGRKGENIFQVSPYAHIQHEAELPGRYIRDPVGLAFERQAYLSEWFQKGET